MYPLSPRDLAAYDRLPELIAAGISALKIEGRLKEPEYVALITKRYRELLDALQKKGISPICAKHPPGRSGKLDLSPFSAPAVLTPRQVEEMEVAFSRGFSHGWLDGPNPHGLICGDGPGKRGAFLGTVKDVRGNRIMVELAGPVRRGVGVVFSGPDTEDEQGGRVFEVFVQGRSVEEEVAGGRVELTFGRDALDMGKIHPGQKVWKTDDPQLLRTLRRTFTGKDPQRRVSLRIAVSAAVGRPLVLDARAASGAFCTMETESPLAEAEKHPLTAETLREQLGRLGGTVYELDRLDATIEGRPMVPLSVLGRLRREMIETLDASLATPSLRELSSTPVLPTLRADIVQSPPCPAAEPKGTVPFSPTLATRRCPENRDSPRLLVLCRNLKQLRAALDSHADAVIVDFLEPEEISPALHSARAEGVPLLGATCRVHSAEDDGRWRYWAELGLDGILARNLAAIRYFTGRIPTLVADFSLNAVNELTVDWLCRQGADRVTVAYDLNDKMLDDLLHHAPPQRLEIIVQGHIPLFHTAHCLYCAAFSSGDRRQNCGQPCRREVLRLKDRKGVEHPVLTDTACRNTVFHGQAFSTVQNIPAWRRRGVNHFRIELLDESPEEAVGLMKKVQILLGVRK